MPTSFSFQCNTGVGKLFMARLDTIAQDIYRRKNDRKSKYTAHLGEKHYTHFVNYMKIITVIQIHIDQIHSLAGHAGQQPFHYYVRNTVYTTETQYVHSQITSHFTSCPQIPHKTFLLQYTSSNTALAHYSRCRQPNSSSPLGRVPHYHPQTNFLLRNLHNEVAPTLLFSGSPCPSLDPARSTYMIAQVADHRAAPADDMGPSMYP